MSISFSYSFVAFLVLLLAFLRRQTKRKPIDDVRGPPSPSFLLGHEFMIRNQNQVGDLEFKWVREYGNVVRTRGTWGENVLIVADPKALQYIMHTSGYNFPKRQDVNQSSKLILGRGIIWAGGADHQRHRKIMNPAFTAPQLRSFLPLFHHTASTLIQKMKEETLSGEKETLLDVSKWLAKTTLDAIGQSAFDYYFGALDGAQTSNELVRVFTNLFADSTLYPPKSDILFKGTWKYIPSSILSYVEYLPTREYVRFRDFLKTTKKVAAQLIVQKRSADSETSDSARDVMSVVVRSNASEDPAKKLDEDEMLSQMATILLAGHETTASSLSWLLMELSRHPDHQTRVREEIASLKSKTSTRTNEFTVADLDSLAFTNAAIKESLRLHPIVPTLAREAGRDDVLPLSIPLETISGQTVSEIPIPKGQNILISICAYNRLPEVWGKDADQWKPERFLDATVSKDKQVSLGVFANLMTFSAGIRACIGWRFALLEMQAILVELIDSFVFAPPEKDIEIERKPAGLMIPMVKGRMHEGTQMPLRVSPVV